MSDLQTATDIVALVFMGVILLLIVALGIYALMLKRKIKRTQAQVMAKVNMVKSLPFIGLSMLRAMFKK
jgi:hypothetical protein